MRIRGKELARKERESAGKFANVNVNCSSVSLVEKKNNGSISYEAITKPRIRNRVRSSLKVTL